MRLVRLSLVALLLLVPAHQAEAGKGGSGGGGHSSGGSHSSSGGHSYSSGSHSYSSGSHSYSSGSHASSPPSGGKSYSSGGSSSSGKSYSSGASGKPASAPRPSSTAPSRPAPSSFDSAAGKAAQHAESKSSYQGGRRYSEGNAGSRGPTYTPGQPRSSYSDAKGRTHSIDPKDRRIDQLRRELNEERWYNRGYRSSTVFMNVGPPIWWSPIYYSDPYSNIFWWWLLSPSGYAYRPYWAYNHYYDMDSLRYRDLLAHDASLEARVRQLEQQRLPRDPTYAPQGVDADLMYADQYVQAAVNPTTTGPAPTAAPSASHHFFRSCFMWLAVIGIAVLLIWLIFIKRWGGSEPVQGRRV
jgi:hypothetical protein